MSAQSHPSDGPRSERLLDRRFVIVTASAFAFFLAVGMNLPVLPQFIEQELDHGDLAIGSTLTALSVSAIAARPVIGPLGDRRGRRVLMLGGALLTAAALGSQVLVSSLVALLVARLVLGVGQAAQFVGAATLVNDIAPPHRRAEAASYFSVALYGGLGVGPILGDLLLGDDRYDLVFAVSAGCVLVGFVLAWFAPEHARVPGGRGLPAMAELAVEVSDLRPPRFHPAAFAPGLVLALGMFGYTAWAAFLPPFTEELGMASSAPIFLVYSVEVLLIRVVGARVPERFGLQRVGTGAVAVLTISLAVLAIWGAVPGLVVGTLGLGAGTSMLYPSLMAMTVNAVPEHERSSVISTFTMFFEAGTAVGGLVLGAVAAGLGYQGAFAVGAVVAVGGLAILRLRLGAQAPAAVVPSCTSGG